MEPYPFPPGRVLDPLPQRRKHQRTVLRDHVAAILMYRTLAGEHVYRSRVSPLPEDICAALVVFTASENARQVENTPAQFDNTLTLTIEARVLAAEGDYQGRTDGADQEENWDTVLDGLCTEVEDALFLDPWLNQTVTITALNTRMGFSGDGAFVPGVAVIEAQLAYPWEAPTNTAGGDVVIGVQVDVIEPAADPNRLGRLNPPRATGPDGRVEIDAGVLHRARS
ncbi:hypothetical protein [Elstera sp.]|jgi:hypothetical protein|uniref:hypothetical protein n=1 Tax=Elstera sp. TaxID=1916664 RepID=UPI0037BEEAD2